MKIQIERIAEDRFDVLVDGGTNGQYETVAKAKAGARRFFPSYGRVKWFTGKDGLLFGTVQGAIRKPGNSF